MYYIIKFTYSGSVISQNYVTIAEFEYFNDAMKEHQRLCDTKPDGVGYWIDTIKY